MSVRGWPKRWRHGVRRVAADSIQDMPVRIPSDSRTRRDQERLGPARPEHRIEISELAVDSLFATTGSDRDRILPAASFEFDGDTLFQIVDTLHRTF